MSSALPEDYHSHSRPDLRKLFPPAARMAVDVGCGAGAVGAALKRDHPGLEVRGIELDAAAAERAAGLLDAVAVQAGEEEPPASWPAPDCVILADVLEHMTDPWSALRRWGPRLRPGGCILVSLPNVGHYSVQRALRAGRWDYEEEGILDRTHVRFFTRATAVELLEGAGFGIEVMDRAMHLPEGMPGRRILKAIVRRAREQERAGRSVPAWKLRVLDGATRQLLFRARLRAPP